MYTSRSRIVEEGNNGISFVYCILWSAALSTPSIYRVGILFEVRSTPSDEMPIIVNVINSASDQLTQIRMEALSDAHIKYDLRQSTT